jgi:hypothetical protein
LLAQLDALKNAARDFAAREEKLNRAFHEQAAKEADAFAAQDQRQTVAASERMAAEADGFAAAKRRLAERFARRRARLNHIQSRMQERIEAEINLQDEECKRQAQQGLMDAEQQRNEKLSQAAAAWENFQQRQAEIGAAFSHLEKSVRHAFGGYGGFRRQLDAQNPPAETGVAGDSHEALAEVQRLSAKIEADVRRFKKSPLPQIFRFVPVWLAVLVLLGIAVAHPVLARFGNHSVTALHAIISVAALAVILVIYLLGRRAAAPLAKIIAADFTRARRLLEKSGEQAAAYYQAEQARIETEFQDAKNAINQEWKRLTKEIAQSRGSRPVEMENRLARLHQRNEQLQQTALEQRQEAHEKIMAQLRAEAAQQTRQLAESREAARARRENGLQNEWRTLATEWQHQVRPLGEKLQAAQAAAETLFPEWSSPVWQNWQPPREFLDAVKFGRLEVELEKFIGALPRDPRLALPCPPSLSLPLLLTPPQAGSLLFETGKAGGAEAVEAINNLILRLLATTPPGRIEFTIFDPVGLGQNFAALMHLADYEANTINSRIWTQSAQFEEKLAELNEHMEKIIQMYLRNEYATITEYNAQAGSVAEKYHFLVIASFPVNFTEAAAKRLRNIAANGARCGVFTLIQWDQRNALPQDFVPDELRQHSVDLARAENGFEFSGWRAAGTRVILDAPPATEFTTQLLRHIGKSGVNSNRVEVPFAQVAPAEKDFWTEETGGELRVPIGRSGATKLQYLALGRDTRQHALIAGKTGSGKSTLFHIIVTNLALRCSPEQVEFYLVDFKKGVEFKCYASHRLPHAKVVAIESDRAFGLSVLQRVDEELRRRGDLFRQAGAQDLAGYQRARREPMPRVLLMIDEFQEFFVEEDRISQNAAVLLDRIVRQGRAFGIHVILGSQTLGGAYTLARATIGQMVIRIALQCNEADAYLIMDQDNPAPRLLSRPGEGIYNDTAGSIEGNSPFQAVWLPDRTREDCLAKIRARADQSGHDYPGPIVFEGNAPADVRENLPLRAALKNPGKTALPPRLWLGTPNAIKGPTEVIFRRQSGSHLLVVGQSDERMLTILSLALVSLAAQHAPDGAKFFVLHNLAAGNPQHEFLQRVVQAVPQPVVQANNGNLAEVIGGLAEALKQRAENESSGAEIFVLIHDLQNFKKLRQEDEFSFSASPAETTPAATWLQLINEGPARGLHALITCDTYGNVNRFLGRKALGEIEMRVAFQMSANDSASLIDAPDAAALGLHRAVLFNEREGSLETFRPYALPENDWLEAVARQLKQR